MRTLVRMFCVFLMASNSCQIYAQKNEDHDYNEATTHDLMYSMDVPAPAAAPVATAAPAPAAPAPASAKAPAGTPAVAPASAPAVPAPVVDASASKPAGDEDDKASMDTLSVEGSGNWRLNRHWYQLADKSYGEINSLLNDILETRAAFREKKNKIENTILNPLIKQIGVTEGEFDEITKRAQQDLEAQKKSKGQLDTAERELQVTIEANLKSLEQLRNDYKIIADFDKNLEDATVRLEEQINLSRQYQKESWELFSTIVKEINDKVNRETYYKIRTLKHNERKIKAYITGPLTEYFTKLEENAKTYSDRVTAAIADLKAKGVDLKQKFAEKQTKESEQDATKVKETQVALKKSQDVRKTEPNIVSVWFNKFYDWCLSVWNSITTWFKTERAVTPATKEALAGGIPAMSVQVTTPAVVEPAPALVVTEPTKIEPAAAPATTQPASVAAEPAKVEASTVSPAEAAA